MENPAHLTEDLLKLLSARRGHFILESGHHGDLWLDLELLCLQPRSLRAPVVELAERLRRFQVDVICGPLVEGAFVALMVAAELNVQFTYSQRFVRGATNALFPAGYRIPNALRPSVTGKRLAIVNDVINAGSAVRGTVENLENYGAKLVAIGTLLTLGGSAEEYAASKGVALETLANLPNSLWEPSSCTLCASGVPLEDLLQL